MEYTSTTGAKAERFRIAHLSTMGVMELNLTKVLRPAITLKYIIIFSTGIKGKL
jgi:hypothetical protein